VPCGFVWVVVVVVVGAAVGVTVVVDVVAVVAAAGVGTVAGPLPLTRGGGTGVMVVATKGFRRGLPKAGAKRDFNGVSDERVGRAVLIDCPGVAVGTSSSSFSRFKLTDLRPGSDGPLIAAETDSSA
jgi:hypothetical protein